MRGLFIFCLSLGLGLSARADSTLYLFGGGDRPQAAIGEFVRATGVKRPRVLVVTWATELPTERLLSISDQLVKEGAQIRVAFEPPRSERDFRVFNLQLAGADAIFFSGGDQERVLDAFQNSAAGRESWDRLRRRVRDGMPYAGTSAGTAAVGSIAITGYDTPLRAGLNLLPGYIVDTHFYVRERRLARLRDFVEASADHRGLGVDEDAVVRVTLRDDGTIEMFNLGPYGALLVGEETDSAGRFVLEPGELRRLSFNCGSALAPY